MNMLDSSFFKNKPMTAIETEITNVKSFRKELDAILQGMKTSAIKPTESPLPGAGSVPGGRERALAITNLQQSIMWLGMNLKELGAANPYPTSYDPSSTTVEPTADGLKL